MINAMILLLPLSIILGLIWLGVFIWCLRDDQYTDLEGSSQRILFDEDSPINSEEEDARG